MTEISLIVTLDNQSTLPSSGLAKKGLGISLIVVTISDAIWKFLSLGIHVWNIKPQQSCGQG